MLIDIICEFECVRFRLTLIILYFKSEILDFTYFWFTIWVKNNYFNASIIFNLVALFAKAIAVLPSQFIYRARINVSFDLPWFFQPTWTVFDSNLLYEPILFLFLTPTRSTPAFLMLSSTLLLAFWGTKKVFRFIMPAFSSNPNGFISTSEDAHTESRSIYV